MLTLKVIGSVLAGLGEAWEKGQISISDGHLASNYLRQRLLLWLVSAPLPRNSAQNVLACAPGGWHESSLLMLGVLLRRRGWPVAYQARMSPLPAWLLLWTRSSRLYWCWWVCSQRLAAAWRIGPGGSSRLSAARW
jgi:hypothetical protein